MNTVLICGLPYNVIECQECFGDGHCGEIDYRKQIIRINKDMADGYKKQTLIHEMLHGILTCIGRDELSNDEQFVQALANGIYTSTFDIKRRSKDLFKGELEKTSFLSERVASLQKKLDDIETLIKQAGAAQSNFDVIMRIKEVLESED